MTSVAPSLQIQFVLERLDQRDKCIIKAVRAQLYKSSNYITHLSHIVSLEITSFRQKIRIKQLSGLIFNELLRCSPPQSALAVAIFTLVKDKHISQKEIAKVCDTSLLCLRRLCQIYKNDISKLQLLVEERSTNKVFYYKET